MQCATCVDAYRLQDDASLTHFLRIFDARSLPAVCVTHGMPATSGIAKSHAVCRILNFFSSFRCYYHQPFSDTCTRTVITHFLKIRNSFAGSCLISMIKKKTFDYESESIECFIEGQALSWPYDLAPRPPTPLSPVCKLDQRHSGRLRKRDNLLTGVGVWEEMNQTTAREPGPLTK